MKSKTYSHPSHPLTEPVRGGNIARAGAPKRTAPTMVHNGMTERQQRGMQVGGMGHPVNSGEQLGSNPLAKPGKPKTSHIVATGHGPGAYHRTLHLHELGR